MEGNQDNHFVFHIEGKQCIVCRYNNTAIHQLLTIAGHHTQRRNTTASLLHTPTKHLLPRATPSRSHVPPCGLQPSFFSRRLFLESGNLSPPALTRPPKIGLNKCGGSSSIAFESQQHFIYAKLTKELSPHVNFYAKQTNNKKLCIFFLLFHSNHGEVRFDTGDYSFSRLYTI